MGRWDTATWTRDPGFSLSLHGRSFPRVSPDGGALALTNWSGPFRLVDAETGVVLVEDRTFSTRVDPVSFLDDTRLLALSFREGPVIWDVKVSPGLRMALESGSERLVLGGDRAWWWTEAGHLRSRARDGTPVRTHGVLPGTTRTGTPGDARILGASSDLAVTVSDGIWSGWAATLEGPVWRVPASDDALSAEVSPDGAFVAIRTREGRLLVFSSQGQKVLEHVFVSPGDVIVDGVNHGVMPSTDTRLLWAPDAQSVLAQHQRSGERWMCQRADWTCSRLDQQVRQFAFTFSPRAEALYGTALVGDGERPGMCRLPVSAGPAQWIVGTDPLRSRLRDAAATDALVVAVSGEGQLVQAPTDGSTVAVAELGAYSLERVQFLADERRAVITGWEPGQLWVWDTEARRLLAQSSRGDWRYRQTRGADGAQVWAVVDDRLLTTVALGEAEAPASLRARALAATNVRICAQTLEPVVVVPVPDGESPWAPEGACGPAPE